MLRLSSGPILLSALFCLLSYSSTSEAQYFQADFMKKKQEQVEQSRWTLADWLATKEKMSLMDLWLAMNSSANVFEFSVLGSTSRYNRSEKSGASSDEVDRENFSGSAHLYFYLFGISGSYEDADKDYERTSFEGLLRILGTSHQSTNLTAKYGLTSKKAFGTENEFDNAYWGGELTLNIFSAVGLYAEYIELLESENDALIKTTGYRWRAGCFLEAQFLRFFGYWFEEEMDAISSASTSQVQRSGIEAGIQLFF